MADAEIYQRDEAIPWIVAVDDVDGTVHRSYGGLANPADLVGTDGRISLFQPTTGALSLERALGELGHRRRGHRLRHRHAVAAATIGGHPPCALWSAASMALEIDPFAPE